MNNKARKVISLFLILAIVLGILPAISPPVRGEGAEETTVNTWEELVYAMSSRSDYSKVILGKNMKYEYKYDRDNPHGIDNLVRVTNEKTLDLNGKKIELVDQSSAKRDGYRPAAFFIRAGGTLHVIDSKGGGEVWHHSQLREEWGWHEEVKNRTSHNVFDNSGGTLVIDGGKFIAGRKSKTWCFNVHRSTGMREGLTTIYYDGWAYNLSSGNAVRHSAGDTVINDGTFHSYGESTIKAVRETNSSGKLTINGGDYRLMGAINYEATSVIDAAILNEKIDFHVNGGNFSTEKMIVRRGAEGSYQQTNYGWNVYLIEPYIAIGIPFITFNEDARFKYDGKNRDLEWVKSNLPKSSKKFEVIPGTPKLSLSPEVEDDVYLLARGLGEYSIKGQVEPYFKDLGLGRPANVEYNIYDYDLGKNTRTREVWVDTSKSGLTTYAFIVDELTINGKKIGSSHKYFDVLVKDQPIPKITILPETNPVIKGDPVKLVAYSDKADQLMRGYEWKYYDGEDIGTGKTIEFNAPSVDGEYLIQCVGTDIYENKGVGLFLLQVGGEGARPRIATDELIFKQDKSSNGLYVENIGGPLDNKDWSVEGDLPPGLEFVTNLGLPGFRGTPTQAGTWPVKIKADVVKGYEKTINIIVTAPIEIGTNPKLPDGVKGEEYQGAELYVSGGGDVKWTVIDGALPSGLDLDINTGKISGTPTPDYSGRFKFTLQAEVTGEIPAIKNFNIDIHAKPEFKENIQLTAPYGKETYFPSYLKDGTGDIEYWLTGAPTGISITPASDTKYGPGRIYVGSNVAKGDHTFTIHAKGYKDSTASATVNLKVTEKPTLTDGMFIYLPYGEVGKDYSDDGMIKDSIYSAKGGNWTLESGTLPVGLTLSNDGKITGTPSEDTGIASNGYPGSVSLTLKFTDEDGLPETILAFLYIVKAGDNKATSKIGFDTSKANVDSATKATMYTGMVNFLFIDIDGVPRPEYEITGLPDWISHSAPDGKGNVTLESTFPPETGSFDFTVRAKNDLNNDWVEQELTIQVKNPEKAAAPTATPGPDTYKKSELPSVELKNNESGTVKIFYSINGGEFIETHVEKDGEISIDIVGDTTIRTYTDTLFGLTGVKKSNSDIATYKYMVIEDESKALITIENKSLADGKVDTAYTDVELEGSSSNGEDLTWTVTGLPAGLKLDSAGKKIEGTPSVAGDFNVTLFASAEGADSAKKVLQLHIADKSLPKAENPTISSQPASKEYNLNDSATALTVTATTTDGGNLSYLWYESQDKSNETPEDDKIVAMEKGFTPPTDVEGEKYYYALVSNSKDNHQAGRARSNLATIKVTVKIDAQTPYFDDEGNREYLFTQNTEQIIMEMALVDDDGLLSYEWYKMKGTSPNPESDDKITLTEHDKDGILNITTPATNGAVDKYYAMVTNTKGNKTAGPIQSPIHVVEVTEKVMYEITFDLQNDDLPKDERTFTVTTDFDGKLGDLPQAEREGFTFKGWYKEANGTTKVTSDQVYTKNTNLYAQWTADTYTVTVQDDGKGTATANPSSGGVGTEITLSATPNSGYKFKEWQIVSGGVTIADNKFTMPSENVVIKAIFEEASIVVDKTTLIDAIASAKTNKGTAAVSPDGTDIDPLDKWVTQVEMDAYTGAITTAQGVADKTDASQTEVDNAVAALNTATIKFNSAKKSGTKLTIEITGVTISPKSTSVEKGKTQEFIASVAGTGSFDKTVTWSISGNNDGNTTISSSGLLTVDAEETATSLTVTATSNGDSNISDSATVTVTDQEVASYTVTVDNGTGGGTYAEGAVVSITADNPPAGKEFDKWTSSDLSLTNENAATTTFKMPAKDVTIKATYKDLPIKEYTVTVQDDGKGSGSASPSSAVAGKEITLSATPNEGYKFKEWQVVGGGVTITNNKFTMPDNDVVVKATFEEVIPQPSYSYQITEGANSSWDKSDKKAARFVIDGDFDIFQGVKVNGKLLDAKNYKAEKGSVIVSLLPEYLKTLTTGEYTIGFVFGEREVETGFKVTEANETDPTDPVEPVDPTDPVEPVDPVGPVDPTDPVDPVDPVEPTDPVEPKDPGKPKDPASSTVPKKPIEEKPKETLPTTGENSYTILYVLGLLFLTIGILLIFRKRRQTN